MISIMKKRKNIKLNIKKHKNLKNKLKSVNVNMDIKELRKDMNKRKKEVLDSLK